jgi:3-deoxy-manno-octulosonate cytidylyltransferase (CMP-KDO synthetase)
MNESPRIIGVIPARFDSQRLPGKVLREIAGKPMIYWVYHNARKSPLLAELLVATDSERVQQYCAGAGIPVMMTGRHESGTDRLHEVMLRTDFDIYVNVQGDEPTLTAEHLERLLEPFSQAGVQVTTLRVLIDHETAQDPNIVKVVTDRSNRALYFSRYPIPYDRDGTGCVRYYKHIGLYAYQRSALALFHSLPQASLELAEKLEQLRFLQNGVQIFAAETALDTVGVDTLEDLLRVQARFSAGTHG